jgi:hypothetical protein
VVRGIKKVGKHWSRQCGIFNFSQPYRPPRSVVIIIMRIKDSDLHRKYFRQLKILPQKSQYKYSLSLFVINSEIQNANDRTKSDSHHPLPHLPILRRELIMLGLRF